MDWGIDPERVSEIAEIIRNRRFSAPDAEKLMLAIVGGAGEHADSPLWDMAQILLGLGVLAKQPRLGPRDAAIACLLDETGMMIGPLKRGKEARHSLVAIASSAEGLTLTSGGEPRVYGWGRVKRAMGLADFLFNSPFVDPGAGNGVDALRQALDTLFAEEGDLTTLSKKAVQAPARYMRAWRKRYLPLQAFADLIRHREAFLAEHKRAHARDLDHEDIFTLWRFAVGRGETWSFTRYSEKLAALMREERTDNERRAFISPVAIDGMVTGEPSEDPESAIIAWLDGEMEPDLDEAPIVEAPDDEGEEEKWTDRTMSALNALPDVPKMLTKEERRQAAAALALLPLAHEQPHTLLRAIAVAQWENRLIEATRRGKAEDQPSNLDYLLVHGELQALDQRFGELILIGLFLASPAGGAAMEGGKILKKWRHDRASFRIEDAELAQTFTIMGHDLRAVANALKRILLQLGRLETQADLTQLASADEPRFAAVFTERYNLKARM